MGLFNEKKRFRPHAVDQGNIRATEKVRQESESEAWSSPRYSESRTVQLDQNALDKHNIIGLLPDPPELDHYRLLRTQIQQRTKAKGWNTIMVTSAHPGEGKTMTSINLAFMFAREYDCTALLVDCDLRRQCVHKYLGYKSDAGIGDFLLRNTPLNDLIVWPGVEKLTIISGGKIIRNSTELLGSPQMKELVTEMKNRYANRYIIFDVPPLMSRSDAVAFAPVVDGVLFVVAAGKTSIYDVQKSIELIPRDKFLGFVLNRIKGRSSYYYGYY